MSNPGAAIVGLELAIADRKLQILRQATRQRFNMKTPRLESSTLASVMRVVAFLALSSLAAPKVCAQSSPTESAVPGGIREYRRASAESLYTAARPPELTYTNSVYGLSFRFPSNFTLHLGNYSRGIFSSHSDRGEILLATDMIPSGFWMGTNAAVIILFVGVNPMISMESCKALVAPDGWTSGAALQLTVDGLEFKGRNEIEKSTGTGAQSGVGNIYERQYAGYSHGVCYEFEIDLSTVDQSRMRIPGGLVQVDLERVFAEMEAIILTAKFEVPNPGALAAGAKAEHVTKPWETSLPIPKELEGLDALTDWDIQYPTGAPPAPFVPRFQFKICGTGDSGSYMPITFVYGASSSLDNAAANAAVDKLIAEVTQLVQKNGWKMGSTDCYTKGSVFVDFGKGTGRCTMNSPCTAYDILSVTLYIPVPPAGAAQ